MVTDNGEGQIMVLGADWSDGIILDEAKAVLAFLRLRAVELCTWLVGKARTEYLDPIRDHRKDVVVMITPGQFLKQGPSCSVAIFLALLKLFFGCEIKKGVAVTGVLSFSGYILRVSDVADKANGLLQQGIDLVVAPHGNRNDAVEYASALDWGKVRFVKTVVDVLELTVEGE